jgi:phosphoglycerate dehydrogenase-like enzyme
MKILYHHQASKNLKNRLKVLENEYDLEIICFEGVEGDFCKIVKDVDVIWHVLTPLTTEIIKSATKLRLIQKIGVGVNTIELQTAKSNSISVCNMPGTNSRAVAEMTLLLIMSTLRRLTLFDRACRSGNGWNLDPAAFDNVSEVFNKKIGLLGSGAVPKILKPMLESLGATVLYTDRSSKPDTNPQWRPLNELLKEADILSLHVPLTSETEGIIGARQLELMKEGSILINTARGELVDEQALIRSLSKKHIAAAGLDVFVTEPVSKDNKLLKLENVVTTPHIAWLTRETFTRSFEIAVENCRRLQQNQELLHRVI